MKNIELLDVDTLTQDHPRIVQMRSELLAKNISANEFLNDPYEIWRQAMELLILIYGPAEAMRALEARSDTQPESFTQH